MMLDLLLLGAIGTVAAAATIIPFVVKSRHRDGFAAEIPAIFNGLNLEHQLIDKTWRGEGKLSNGMHVLVDISQPSASDLFCTFVAHVRRPELMPPNVELDIPASASEQRLPRSILSEHRRITINVTQHQLQVSARGFLSALYPDGYKDLELLEGYELEPSTRMRHKKNWSSIERIVSTQSVERRDLTSPAKQREFIQQLIKQTLNTLSGLGPGTQDLAELWKRTFLSADAFSRGRQKALELLLEAHSDSEQAEQVWQHILREGNLYDMLYLINNHQQRALSELSDERLIAFVNAVLTQDNLDKSALPHLMSRKLDFSVLTNSNLDWGARSSLLELWMTTLGEPNVDLSTELARAFADPSAPHKNMLALVEKTRWVGAIDALAMLRFEQSPPWRADLDRTWRVLGQHHAPSDPEQAQDPPPIDVLERHDIDQALAHLLSLTPNSSDIIAAAGLLGGKEVLPALHALSSKSNALIGHGREARRAIEAIVERLGAASRGGLSLANTRGGELSQSEQSGGLFVVEPGRDD